MVMVGIRAAPLQRRWSTTALDPLARRRSTVRNGSLAASRTARPRVMAVELAPSTTLAPRGTSATSRRTVAALANRRTRGYSARKGRR